MEVHVNMTREVLRLSPAYQKDWVKYLDFLAKGIYTDHGDLCVLKGGSALTLVYNSPRYSVDLDYDLVNKIDLSETLQKYAVSFINNYFNANIIVNASINARSRDRGTN